MKSRRMIVAAQALVAALALAAVALPVNAGDSPAAADSVSRKVHVGDLDLSTSSGRHKLERRLKQAAWQVCSITAPTQGPSRMDHGRCIKALSSAARTEVYAAQRPTGPLVVGSRTR